MSKRLFLLAALLLTLTMPLVFSAALAQTGWYVQTSPVAAQLKGVDFVDADHGWICGSSGTILCTADGGATWIQQELGPSLDVKDIDFVDLNNGYAVGAQSTVWRTVDGGATWAMIRHSEGPPAFGSVFVIDPQTLWVTGYREGGSGGYLASVSVTSDAGAHWSLGEISYNDGHPCGTFAQDVFALDAPDGIHRL